MDPSEVFSVLSGYQKVYIEVEEKYKKNEATHIETRSLQSLKTNLMEPKLVKQIKKFVQKSQEKDVETQKPKYKQEFIQQVEVIQKLYESLIENVAELYEKIKYLDEIAVKRAEEIQRRQLQLEQEEREQKEALELIKKVSSSVIRISKR